MEKVRREEVKKAVEDAKRIIKNGTMRDAANKFTDLYNLAFYLHVREGNQKAVREWMAFALAENTYIQAGHDDIDAYLDYYISVKKLLKNLVRDMQKAVNNDDKEE